METVLVIGSTGNVGTAAVIGALNSGRQVLAIVRNQESAAKLIKNIGSDKGITTVEADIMSADGVRGVVEQVKAGKLPAFQHVYSAGFGCNSDTKLTEVSRDEVYRALSLDFDPNLFAYQATVPYLLEQGKPSSWTICTGASGKFGIKPAMAIGQSALMALITAAMRELANTNIRFNENLLCLRVDIDGKETDHTTSSVTYAKVYEDILNSDLRGSRIDVCHRDDLTLQHHSKNKGAMVTWTTPRSRLTEFL